jgi:hypothetical protein
MVCLEADEITVSARNERVDLEVLKRPRLGGKEPTRLSDQPRYTSVIRAELSWATRFPRRCCDTVTALFRFTVHGDLMPSSSFRAASDGTPRIVEVTGATVTVDKYAMALSRVSTKAGIIARGRDYGQSRQSC